MRRQGATADGLASDPIRFLWGQNNLGVRECCMMPTRDGGGE
jgi:hypothetical protein